jgi:ketosteroid isomerase-like protein
MPATTPDEINELFEAAINAGDVDAALSLYEPSASLVAAPGEPVFGVDAIREVLQESMPSPP